MGQRGQELLAASLPATKEYLYLVYEGIKQDTGRPIIKVHLNPLVRWIWLGVWIIIAGTIICLVENALLPGLVSARALSQAAPLGVGD